MKKNVFLISLLLFCSIILIFVGYIADRRSKPNSEPPVSDAIPHIEISMQEKEVSLVGSVVEEWLKGEATAAELHAQYRQHGQTYAARTVMIQWGIFDIPDGSFIRKQYFDLSTGKSFQNAQRYELRSGERSIELQNLLVDTQYYFRITLELENDQGCIVESDFRTNRTPRILEFENLRNIRDIGGWKTADGKSVKQGLLYRGCELDGATVDSYQITQWGIDTMVEQLKIKTELDLRSSETEGVRNMLGSNVEHRYFALPSYSGCFLTEGNEKIREIFASLAVQENYPVYLHCTNGVDRTGIVCYLLEALLGVPEADCYKEWELSMLVNGGGKYEEMDRFVKTLQAMEGNTLQEKTENYLLSIGVTQLQINHIRSIMLVN